MFLESSIVACINFSNMPLKETKVIALRMPKIFVPIMPPLNVLAAQLEKIPSLN